jgi:transcriptional regulator with XRE-family HTH domain
MSMRDRDEFEINQVKDIGKFFAQLRFKRNKSQREEAEELGCSQATLTRFEQGKDEYRLSLLQKFAAHYGYRLEISIVPIDESIDTRTVLRPDPNIILPTTGVREPRKNKPKLVQPVEVVYEDPDDFDIEAEMAAMRTRLAG